MKYSNSNQLESELNLRPETGSKEGTSRQDQSAEVFSALRQRLLDLVPNGANGFEGLIAAALAECSGLTFRLAKSGSQFGRDASSSPGSFAVAMEAKRYQDPPSLEIVVSKGLLAADFLDGAIDLWVLGCAAPVGDEVVLRLKKELDDRGISLLVLDWTPYPLPPLAVLLATGCNATLEWFEQHQPESGKVMTLELSEIRSSVGFEAAKTRLLLEISSSELGLDAARARNRDWLVERFKEPGKAQLAFGQYLSVLDSKRPVVVRQRLLAELDAWNRPENSENIAVILGSEGSGKSWLIANWWTRLLQPPIFLVSAGYFPRGDWVPCPASTILSPQRQLEFPTDCADSFSPSLFLLSCLRCRGCWQGRSGAPHGRSGGPASNHGRGRPPTPQLTSPLSGAVSRFFLACSIR